MGKHFPLSISDIQTGLNKQMVSVLSIEIKQIMKKILTTGANGAIVGEFDGAYYLCANSGEVQEYLNRVNAKQEELSAIWNLIKITTLFSGNIPSDAITIECVIAAGFVEVEYTGCRRFQHPIGVEVYVATQDDVVKFVWLGKIPENPKQIPPRMMFHKRERFFEVLKELGV